MTKTQLSTPIRPRSRLNVAQRLAETIRVAKSMGFQVRRVVLEDQAPGWCQIGDKRILFLDLTSSTTEQLAQLDEILASVRQSERIARAG